MHIGHIIWCKAYTAQINICNQLIAQGQTEGAPWGDLVVNGSTMSNLRALSPNSAIVLNPGIFSTYFDNYVNQVWTKYASTPLTVDSQASYGNVQGTVVNNLLTFPNGVTFTKPSTADIFSCSTGPFVVTGAEQAALVPRLAAAFNRTVLLTETETPIPTASAYYQNPQTNHYARIVHANNVDGHGYGKLQCRLCYGTHN